MKDFFENTPQVLRMMTEPSMRESVELFKRIIVLHNKYLKHALIVKGNVKEVAPDKVITDNATLFFDYLIIATGRSYRNPEMKLSKNNGYFIHDFGVRSLANASGKIENSSQIVVIGGGYPMISFSHSFRRRWL